MWIYNTQAASVSLYFNGGRRILFAQQNIKQMYNYYHYNYIYKKYFVKLTL